MGKLRKRRVRGATDNVSSSTQPHHEEKPASSSATITSSSRITKFLSDYPLIAACGTVGLGYLLYRLYLLLRLQHPPSFLRPTVTLTEERQVLIVGTQGSGTTQVATELSQRLGLEVGHEVSDTTTHFCRDGTVSWFYAIRFWKNDSALDASKLCGPAFVANMGFHPRMYGPCRNGGCTFRECRRRLQREAGCHWRNDCYTPFRTNLGMARHPLRTVESLVVKFCNGTSLEDVHPVPDFVHVLQVLAPHIVDWEELSCVETMATYVLDYYALILPAVDGMFRIEDTSPCEVAQLAGFVDQPVYPPHAERIERKCRDEGSSSRAPFGRTRNRRNKGYVRLNWKDLEGGHYGSRQSEGGSKLKDSLKELTQTLGYSLDDEVE